MKYTGVTTVKNEADIIEPFVRHNLHYLDHLIVMDDGSTDDTPRILGALQEEGLPLEIRRQDSLGFFQAETMTALMREAAISGADWIFLLDADEFLQNPDGKRIALEPNGTVPVLLPWITYCPDALDDPFEYNPVLRIQHRLAEECDPSMKAKDQWILHKAVVPRTTALLPDIQVVQGNHKVESIGREIEHHVHPDCVLGHFSLRTPGQYASKISVKILKRIARVSPQSNTISFYFRHLEPLKDNFTHYCRNFTRFVPSYMKTGGNSSRRIKDPMVYRGNPLRHTRVRDDASLFISNLWNHAESMARALADYDPVTPESEVTSLRLEILESKNGRTAGGHTLTAGPVNAASAVLDLPDRFRGAPIHLRMSGPFGMAECTRAVLTGLDGTLLELTGPALRRSVVLRGHTYPVSHYQYVVFVKGNGPADLEITPPTNGPSGPWKRISLTFHYEIRPNNIGARYFTGKPTPEHEQIQRLEARIREMTTLRGFLNHHRRWILQKILRRT